MDRIPEGWTTIGKWTLKQRYDKFEEASNMAEKLSRGDEFTPYFRTYYAVVEIISKEEYTANKWDEFTEYYNKYPQYRFSDPINDFCEWMKTHNGDEFTGGDK